MKTSPNAFASLIAAGALVVFGAAAPAAAEAPPLSEGSVSVEVSLVDLDLGSQAGAAVAVGRIKAAAREVCKDAAPRSVLAPRAVHECERDTVARTVREIGGDRQMLAALSQAKSAQD